MPSIQSQKSIFNKPPTEDKGSEASYGFDYQAHCITRLCLSEMVSGHDVVETICEYHEDFVQKLSSGSPRFCQVKKRESADTLTISSLKEAILKLFGTLQYKDVGQLIIYAHGRPSAHGDCTLAGLITLLDRPEDERDGDWHSDLEPFVNCITEMFKDDLDVSRVRYGLQALRIDLNMPHPEAIESENVMLTVKTLHRVWGVEVGVTVAQTAYDALYKRVWDASKKPRRSVSEKRITCDQARDILRKTLHASELLAESPRMLLDTSEKLTRGNLREYLPYALEKRMTALEVRFQLDLKSTDWQDLRDDIAVAWEGFQDRNPGLVGKRLWLSVRDLLTQLGKKWSLDLKSTVVGPEFAEGVFFDMMAICEADIRA